MLSSVLLTTGVITLVPSAVFAILVTALINEVTVAEFFVTVLISTIPSMPPIIGGALGVMNSPTPGTVSAIQVLTVLSLIGAAFAFGVLVWVEVEGSAFTTFHYWHLLILNAGVEAGVATSLLLCSFRVVGCCFCHEEDRGQEEEDREGTGRYSRELLVELQNNWPKKTIPIKRPVKIWQ